MQGQTAPSAPSEPTEPQQRDLTIRDIWIVLRRRRAVVLSVLGIAVLGAVGVSWIMPPVYQSRAVIQIGKLVLPKSELTADSVARIAGREPIEQPQVLVQRLREIHGISGATVNRCVNGVQAAMASGGGVG